MRKQKEAKTLNKDFFVYFLTRFCESQNLDLDCHADSANLLAMTKYYKFALDSQLIRATNRNRSNGSVALHGVLPLATEIRLKSIDKQGAKRRVNCIPQNKLSAQ